jgi:thiosulfate dehydrogenase [quinone] large subunit
MVDVEELFERRMAYLLLRTLTGLDFLLHGGIRVYHGVGGFAAGMVRGLAAAPLPAGFVRGFGYVVPWVELGIGVLLLVGVWTRWALVAASVLMWCLIVGVGLNQDWPTAGLQLGYGLVLFVLLFFRARYEASWMRMLRCG